MKKCTFLDWPDAQAACDALGYTQKANYNIKKDGSCICLCHEGDHDASLTSFVVTGMGNMDCDSSRDVVQSADWVDYTSPDLLGEI